MKPEELTDYLKTAFPDDPDVEAFDVTQVSSDALQLKLKFDDAHLRPGGTISGPSMMKVADSAMYLLVIFNCGDAGKRSATTSLNIQFLKRPPPNDLTAKARMLRLGGSLAVGSVELCVDDEPVAFATVTYAIAKT